jgi:hypothetical protein
VNAYAKFEPWKQDFYTDTSAKTIKGDGKVLFDSALRAVGTKPKGQSVRTKTLADGEAMYLYGGKKALVNEFTDFTKFFGDFVLKPPNDSYWLSVYHDRITVDMNKTKRILMITSFLKTSYSHSAIIDRRLIVDLFEYQIPGPKSNRGFYTHLDLAGLERLVRALPK